jgi:hypothetical protein
MLQLNISLTGLFSQAGLKTYSKLESLLLSACHGDDICDMITEVCDIFNGFDKTRWQLQLAVLNVLCRIILHSTLTLVVYSRL